MLLVLKKIDEKVVLLWFLDLCEARKQSVSSSEQMNGRVGKKREGRGRERKKSW